MLQNHTWMPLLLLPATLSVGCSKEDLTGALDKAKSAVTENAAKAKEAVQAKVESTTETVQEQLNLAGSIELTAGEIVKTDACYASFIRQGAGRPNVLQLQSYRDAEPRSLSLGLSPSSGTGEFDCGTGRRAAFGTLVRATRRTRTDLVF